VNKTVKNVVLVFTLICIAVVAVFCVELVLLNREEKENEQPSLSTINPDEDGTPTPEPEDWGQLIESDPDDGDEANGDPDEADELRPPVEASLFVMPMMIDDRELLVYADEVLFDVIEGESDLLFIYEGDGEARLFIGFDFITPPGGMAELAPRFLYDYLDGGESRVLGDRTIRESAIRGTFVMGETEDETTTYEAWIHSLTGSNNEGMALVFVINYQNETQRDAIYDILNTMELTSDDDEEEEEEENI